MTRQIGIFSEATTWTKQGDIGEARAIYEYTKLGYGVSKPLNDSMPYDLIIDIDGTLKKVQVRTTSVKSDYEIYKVNLRVSGGNMSRSSRKRRIDGEYDILFVLTSEDVCYSIPSKKITARSELALGKALDRFILK